MFQILMSLFCLGMGVLWGVAGSDQYHTWIAASIVISALSAK